MAAGAAAQEAAPVVTERTRLLVDSRYDAAPDSAMAAFMAPYAKVVDSIMSPVVGRTAMPLAAYRRATRHLRWKLLAKNLKCPFMYQPFLRRLVLKSGLTSIHVEGQ